ncbi:MAG: hypothetical protein ACOX7K_04335 [Oscillospiraceae bacterium]|jgi:hypothetical protein
MKKILMLVLVGLLCLTAYHYGRTNNDVEETRSAVTSDIEQTGKKVVNGIDNLIGTITDR